jgi:hypothetical protein
MYKLEATCVFSCLPMFRFWRILTGFDHLGIGVDTIFIFIDIQHAPLHSNTTCFTLLSFTITLHFIITNSADNSL